MSDLPVHQPECFDAPIPGRRWYESCDPDRPRVGPDGRCRECGREACPVCGREGCPDADHYVRFVILCDCGESFTGSLYGDLVECPRPECGRSYQVADLVDVSPLVRGIADAGLRRDTTGMDAEIEHLFRTTARKEESVAILNYLSANITQDALGRPERSTMATITASIRIHGASASVEELERIEDGLVGLLATLGRSGNVRVEVVESGATRLGREGMIRTRTDRAVEIITEV